MPLSATCQSLSIRNFNKCLAHKKDKLFVTLIHQRNAPTAVSWSPTRKPARTSSRTTIPLFDFTENLQAQ